MEGGRHKVFKNVANFMTICGHFPWNEKCNWLPDLSSPIPKSFIWGLLIMFKMYYISKDPPPTLQLLNHSSVPIFYVKPPIVELHCVKMGFDKISIHYKETSVWWTMGISLFTTHLSLYNGCWFCCVNLSSSWVCRTYDKIKSDSAQLYISTHDNNFLNYG